MLNSSGAASELVFSSVSGTDATSEDDLFFNSHTPSAHAWFPTTHTEQATSWNYSETEHVHPNENVSPEATFPPQSSQAAPVNFSCSEPTSFDTGHPLFDGQNQLQPPASDDAALSQNYTQSTTSSSLVELTEVPLSHSKQHSLGNAMVSSATAISSDAVDANEKCVSEFDKHSGEHLFPLKEDSSNVEPHSNDFASLFASHDASSELNFFSQYAPAAPELQASEATSSLQDVSDASGSVGGSSTGAVSTALIAAEAQNCDVLPNTTSLPQECENALSDSSGNWLEQPHPTLPQSCNDENITLSPPPPSFGSAATITASASPAVEASHPSLPVPGDSHPLSGDHSDDNTHIFSSRRSRGA